MMRGLTISVMLTMQLALCHAQQFNVEVYEITESGLRNVFNIRPFINYQKLAVADDHLIVIVDSSVVFTEYDMRSGQQLLHHQLKTQWSTYTGNGNISDLCYQGSGDISVSYYRGSILTYRKNIRELMLKYGLHGVNKIRLDSCGMFTYLSSNNDGKPGSFERIIVESYDTVKNDWDLLPIAYSTDSVRLFNRMNPCGIIDFDFNQKTTVFAFLNTNNELTSFRGLSKQEAKVLLKKSKKGVSWVHQNGLRASQPEHMNDRKIRPIGSIRAFQVVKGDSVMHVLENGDVFVRHYDSELMSNPILNVGDSLLTKGLIYVDKLDRYIWIYPNKIVYSYILSSGVMKILSEIFFEDKIVDFKISSNEQKLALVTRNTLVQPIDDSVKIEIKTIGQ